MGTYNGLVKGIPRGINQLFMCTIINFSIPSELKGHTIPIMYSPTSLSDSIQASFTSTAIPGGSAPQITYANTGARVVSFSFDLPLEYIPPSTQYEDLEDYLNAFRALVYPKYSEAGNKVESPHCKFTSSNIEIDGVCTQCSIEYKVDRFANDGSMAASVSLSFMENLLNISNYDATFVANSLTRVLKNTVVTTQETTVDDTITEINNDDNNNDSRCNIALKGKSNINTTVIGGYPVGFTYSLIGDKVWVDQGYNWNHRDIYSILVLYGYTNGPTAVITDIQVKSNGTYSCLCNGKKEDLSKNDVKFYIKANEIVTAVVIYIPYYDVNKYEVSSSKIRYIHIKGVE